MRNKQKAWLLQIYRASVLVILASLLHQQARWQDQQRRGSPVSLRKARQYFPASQKLQLRDPERGLYFVTDGRGDTIGCLLTTSPQTDDVIGYSGPNNLLIALDSHGAIAGLEMLESGDTPEHVSRVRHDARFLRSFIGWKPAETPPPKIEAVSGATLTSYALVEAVKKRLAGASPSLRFPDPVTLTEVQGLFTNAVRLAPDESQLKVFDRQNRLLGYAVRTSPQADNVSGYRGPTECLVAISPDGKRIIDLRIRRLYDTESYVDTVRHSDTYLRQFLGRRIEELAALDPAGEKMEGVSGATQTTRAITESLHRHFASEVNLRSRQKPWLPKPRDLGLFAVIGMALVISFTALRGIAGLRLAWQLVLIGYVGLVNHDLLSLALFTGWASNGLTLKAAPALAFLGAAALAVPWGTRRQVYCHSICPHGAAQQLFGKLGLPRWKIRPGILHGLERLPAVMLGLAVLLLLAGWKFNLASWEAFDAWSWHTAGLATVLIAMAGLALSLFVPQAYCRFGCPTGALLNFVRRNNTAHCWGPRDAASLALLGLAFATVFGVRAWPGKETEPEPLRFSGPTMGTTWSLKIRDEVADPAALQKLIANQFDWAESLTSHWRTNTDLSRFNRSATTNAMPVPWPVLTLVRQAAELSKATDGIYDVTVGALVRLWGFGPGPKRSEPPSDAEVQAILPSVGWQKLLVLDGMIQKSDPGLEVDLSSIAAGWAIDQVAQLLDQRGFTNFLVESGGELRARGRWMIAIEHPARTCTLSDESIGTSGTYRHNFKTGPKEYSHLIDPRTGRPIIHHTVSVSVRYPDCARADAWGAALNLMGFEAGLPLAERLNLATQFVVEVSEGKFEVRESAAWKARETATSLAGRKKK